MQSAYVHQPAELVLYVLHNAAVATLGLVKLNCVPTSHKSAVVDISTCSSAAQICLLAGYLTLECMQGTL